MTKLIIVCGLPGSGKTVLADELSKRLSIFCLHKDSVKESLYESMKLSTIDDSKIIGYPSVKIIMDLAEENISHGVDVILESPFNFVQEGQIFKDWKNKYKLSIFSIIVSIEDIERKRRLLTRNRKDCHHDYERMVDYVSTESNYNHIPERQILVKSNKPVSELVDDIIKIINFSKK